MFFVKIDSLAMVNQLLRLEAGENTTTQIRNRKDYLAFNKNPGVQTIFTTGLGADEAAHLRIGVDQLLVQNVAVSPVLHSYIGRIWRHTTDWIASQISPATKSFERLQLSKVYPNTVTPIDRKTAVELVQPDQMRSFWVNLNMDPGLLKKVNNYYVVKDLLGRFGGVFTTASAVF